MSDTFFSGAPHWTWFIIPYFFVGGLAGGACFLAAVLGVLALVGLRKRRMDDMGGPGGGGSN